MKKFFKILMVLALLGGAALSCTKDYSKEIQDVQKQNQELQALVASLQNALNSTNATVSKLSATSDKHTGDIAKIVADHATDIAALAGKDVELAKAIAELAGLEAEDYKALADAIEKVDEKLAKQIADLVAAHAEDVAALAGKDEELAKLIADLAELEGDHYKELTDAIENVDGKLTKQITDLASLEAEHYTELTTAIKALNDTLNKQIAELIVTHTEDIETIKTVFDGKLEDLKTVLLSALENKAAELQAEIDALDGRVTVNEEAIDDIYGTLDEISTTLTTHKALIDANREDIDKNIAAIETAKADIEKLQKQVVDLNVRLTNIVAAPAMVTEVQTITIGDIARTIINMDFVVAPASAAKAIAAGFGKDSNLKLTYTLYNAIDRANQTKAAKYEYATSIEPYRVVSLKDGVISVSAVIGKDVVDPTKALYVTLTVAGKDEAGEFERVSDPVKPICDEGHNLLKELRWYDKEGKAVKENPGDIEDIAKAAKTGKGKNEFSDTVFVQGQQLCIIAPDYDWKALPQSNDDILAGYQLKWPVAESQVYTLEEAAKLLDIPFETIKPHFTAGKDKKAFLKSDYAPVEWEDITEHITKDDLEPLEDTTVFVAAGDINSLKLGLKVALKGTEPEQAEYVGAFTQLSSNWIALGTNKIVDDENIGSCNVNYFQRICKHVSNQKAADKLSANFAFNAGKVDDKRVAYKTDTTFSSVKWLSTTSIVRHGDADIYVVKNGEVTADKLEGATANVKEMQAQSKFVEVTLKDVKFAAADQTLRIVWESSKYKNLRGVVTEVYTDYIDLDVEKYHGLVKKEAIADTTYHSHKFVNAIATNLKVADIFKNDNSWFLKKVDDAAQRAELEGVWFTGHVNNEGHPAYASVISPKVTTPLKKVYLTVGANDKIIVNAPENTFKDGTSYTITVKDTIDKVIAFEYVIKLTTKKVGAKIETIPGYVKNDSVYVNGSAIRQDGTYTYKIDDINLTQYYRLANLDQRYSKDSLTAVFATKANVTFDNGKTSPAAYEWDFDNTGKYGVIDYDAKISWNGYNKNSFDLAAVAAVNGDGAASDSIHVTFWTKTPLDVVNRLGDGTLQVGKVGTFDLFADFDVRGLVAPLENIIDNHTIYQAYSKDIVASNSASTPDYGLKTNSNGFRAPQVAPYTKWSCTVDGVEYPYEQMMELFAAEPAWYVVRDQHVGYSDYFAQYQLKFREHSAPATIVFTIPCTWEYAIGKLEFDMIFTLVVE